MTGYAILIDLVTTNTVHYGTQQPVGFEKNKGGVEMEFGCDGVVFSFTVV
jgi:hypothetical protein